MFDLASESVDLVSTCQAIHWFDIPAFYREADRVLRPGSGVLAVIGYHLMDPGPSAKNQPKLLELMQETYASVFPFFDDRRVLVDEGYRTLPKFSYGEAERSVQSNC